MPTRGRLLVAWLVAASLVACSADEDTPSASAAARTAPASSDPASSAVAARASSGPALAWERLDDAPFARLEMAVAAHRDRIWLAGGLSPFGEALTDVEIFDPATGAWADGPALPSAVHHASLVSDGDRLVLIGGYLGSEFNRPTDIVLVLTDGASKWTAGPSLPAPRAAGAAAWDGERVIFAGGVGDGVRADVYALAGDAWERIGTMDDPREHFAAASDLAGRTWLLGGRVAGLDANVATVEVVEGAEISMLDPLPTPRGGVGAFYDASLGACLTGGEAPDRAYTVAECVGGDGSITILPDMLEPHHGHGAAVVDGRAYVLLGGPEPTLSAAATVEALVLPDPAP